MRATASESRMLEYLRMDKHCKALYGREPGDCYTRAHFRLDQLCQEIAAEVKSIRILAHFACLTGNVCYLLRIM